MITVVIPTMWKYKPFVKFLGDLTKSQYVGQIIIIDNNPNEKPDLGVLTIHPKINYVTFGENIFVNPAWNYGVENAKFENVCLLNDDVIVDLKIFHRLDDFLETPNIGVCGICPGLSEEFGHIPLTNGEIDLVKCDTPYNYRTHFGMGTMMFFQKKEYIPIPDKLKLYWGDNFIYDTLYYKLNNNYQIVNTFYYTPYAVTTSQMTNSNEILHNENLIYNNIMPEILNKIMLDNKHITGLHL